MNIFKIFKRKSKIAWLYIFSAAMIVPSDCFDYVAKSKMIEGIHDPINTHWFGTQSQRLWSSDKKYSTCLRVFTIGYFSPNSQLHLFFFVLYYIFILSAVSPSLQNSKCYLNHPHYTSTALCQSHYHYIQTIQQEMGLYNLLCRLLLKCFVNITIIIP